MEHYLPLLSSVFVSKGTVLSILSEGSAFVGSSWKKVVNVAIPLLQGLSLPVCIVKYQLCMRYTNANDLQDMSGSASSPIGTIDYQVSDMTVQSIAVGDTSVSLTASNGIEASVSSLTVGLLKSCSVYQ